MDLPTYFPIVNDGIQIMMTYSSFTGIFAIINGNCQIYIADYNLNDLALVA